MKKEPAHRQGNRDERPGEAQGVVHLFPGQGDFPVAPLLRAVTAHKSVRAAADEVFAAVDAVAVERGLRPLGPWLLGPEPPRGRDLARAGTGLPHLFMYGACLTAHRALELEHGEPSAVLGVSFGEIPALTAAGVYGLADGARIAHDLAVVQFVCPGGLTLLACGEQAARALTRAAGGGAVVACVNNDAEAVVSGPLSQLAAVEEAAAAAGVRAVRLPLPYAAHHPGLSAQADRFAAAVRRYPRHEARRVVHSAVAGRAYRADDDLALRLADCLIRPAHIPQIVRQVAARRPAALYETGTGSSLTRSVRAVLGREAPPAHAPLADEAFPW
ncbi:acyltransferase domain-containing protein [Streptomyces viridochromogenes]|uniref:acyltransferase domain-containing protein n=1 Tax=Streptomyces viridochromogenes TaxID=1938 RepID=UPI00131A195F|nr:acyltransferase domain-containing protein [Streptomyces viridochromogenes]